MTDTALTPEAAALDLERLTEVRSICAGFMRDPGIAQMTLDGGNDDAPMVRAVYVVLSRAARQHAEPQGSEPVAREGEALQEAQAHVREVIRGMKEAGIEMQEDETLGAAIARAHLDLHEALAARSAQPVATSAGELAELFDEIGDAIAYQEAEHAGRGLDREADGLHTALIEVAKIRRAALTTPAAGEQGGDDA